MIEIGQRICNIMGTGKVFKYSFFNLCHPLTLTLSPYSILMAKFHINRLSPPNSGINGSGPRRKQARPRRRSGDSVGNSSLDLSKSDSPINAGTPYNAHHVSGLGRKDPGSSPTSSAGSSQHNPSHLHDDATPENLSMKRPSSSPAINLVSLLGHVIQHSA